MNLLWVVFVIVLQPGEGSEGKGGSISNTVML